MKTMAVTGNFTLQTCAAVASLTLSALSGGGTAAIAAVSPTVISTAHYQKSTTAQCNNQVTCFIAFDKVRRHRQLDVTHIACVTYGSTGTLPRSAYAIVVANATSVFREETPIEFASDPSGPGVTLSFNRAVDLQLSAGELLELIISVHGGTLSSMDCAVTGTIDTLQ